MYKEFTWDELISFSEDMNPIIKNNIQYDMLARFIVRYHANTETETFNNLIDCFEHDIDELKKDERSYRITGLFMYILSKMTNKVKNKQFRDVNEFARKCHIKLKKLVLNLENKLNTLKQNKDCAYAEVLYAELDHIKEINNLVNKIFFQFNDLALTYNTPDGVLKDVIMDQLNTYMKTI